MERPHRDFFLNSVFIDFVCYRVERFIHVRYWGSFVIRYVVALPFLICPWRGGVVAHRGCVWPILFSLSPSIASDADRGTTVRPSTFLLWEASLIDGTPSIGHVWGNPCHRQERGVAESVGDMLPNGPGSTQSLPAFVVSSTGKSGQLSIPPIRILGVHGVVLLS